MVSAGAAELRFLLSACDRNLTTAPAAAVPAVGLRHWSQGQRWKLLVWGLRLLDLSRHGYPPSAARNLPAASQILAALG